MTVPSSFLKNFEEEYHFFKAKPYDRFDFLKMSVFKLKIGLLSFATFLFLVNL